MSSDADFDPEKFKLDPDRNNEIFRKRIVPHLLEGRTRQTIPRAVFLISQPGSGKSRLQKEIDPELKNNGGYIDLDSDLYKPYHDDYDELMQRDDRLMTAATRADGREWMAKAREYALENRINVIVQDTAQDPEHSARMMRDFREAGYEVESVGMAVPKVISDQGIQYRYFEQVRDRGAGRLTVQANADRSYEGVAGVSRLIDEQPGLVDRARLFRRGEGIPCYDNAVENGRWVQEPRLAATLAHEREERPWTTEVATGFVQMQEEMKKPPTPKVEAKLGPGWPTTLAALDERAAEKVTQALGSPSGQQPPGPPSADSPRGQEPDRKLADQVLVNDLLAQRGDRAASRFDMLMAGMGQEETTAAISAWEALGKPETAREREARLGAEQAIPEATQERVQQPATTPEPTREPHTPSGRPLKARQPSAEPQTPPGSLGKAPERHQGTDTQATARTSSAIWETPKPPLESMARHRTEWGRYDDLHGYGRRPQMIEVRTPSKAPGAYETLLHPNTGAAYERDQRQAESGDRGYGE